jgi:hypothetical protein
MQVKLLYTAYTFDWGYQVSERKGRRVRSGQVQTESSRETGGREIAR